MSFLLTMIPTCAFSAGVESFKMGAVGVDLTQQNFFVGVIPASTNSSCGRKDEFKWKISDPGVSQLMSIALTAKASGKNITIGVADTCVSGQATGIWLYIAN